MHAYYVLRRLHAQDDLSRKQAFLRTQEQTGRHRRVRRSPQGLFRDHVDPKHGGKVPEAAHNRLELNKIDALGLKDPQAQHIAASLVDTPLPDKAGAAAASTGPTGGFFGAGKFHCTVVL